MLIRKQGVVCEDHYSPRSVYICETGFMINKKSIDWPCIPDSKSDVSYDSDADVESASICHMVINRRSSLNDIGSVQFEFRAIKVAQNWQ